MLRRPSSPAIHYATNARLAVKARIEDVLNEKYEEVNGYPALGFGAYSGVEWKF